MGLLLAEGPEAPLIPGLELLLRPSVPLSFGVTTPDMLGGGWLKSLFKGDTQKY